MSQPRRSLGPVIAYMLALLGLVLGGIWLWSAVRRTPAPLDGHPAAPQNASAPPRSEDFSATERRLLENILRHQPSDTRR